MREKLKITYSEGRNECIALVENFPGLQADLTASELREMIMDLMTAASALAVANSEGIEFVNMPGFHEVARKELVEAFDEKFELSSSNAESRGPLSFI